MSKAEDRAKERYWLEPNNIETQEKYAAYVEGYHQAEEDNEPTWEDVALINSVVTEMLNECGDNVLYDTEEKFCREVLKRFNKERKEK